MVRNSGSKVPGNATHPCPAGTKFGKRSKLPAHNSEMWALFFFPLKVSGFEDSGIKWRQCMECELYYEGEWDVGNMRKHYDNFHPDHPVSKAKETKQAAAGTWLFVVFICISR